MEDYDLSRVPGVSRRQMVEVDRLMVERYGIQLIQMMENAGRAAARAAREVFLGGDVSGSRIIVAAGRGGNGGGVLAAARRLACWGSQVEVLTYGPLAGFQGVPGIQLESLHRMGINVSPSGGSVPWGEVDLVLDGLIGYGLNAVPRRDLSGLMERIAGSGVPILALDIPSGLDADTGKAPGAALRAAATVTLALPKTGLLEAAARSYVGDLYLADISVPPGLFTEPTLGIKVPDDLFARDDLLRLDTGHGLR